MLAHQQFVAARSGLSDLSFDGSGAFGSGLFGNNWGWAEVVAAAIGAYAFYAMFRQTKSIKYGLESKAGRRRKSRAKKMREKAKKLEEQTTGFGGIFF